MKMRAICVTVGLGVGLAAALAAANGAWAQPAPWFWWLSKVDGQRVCAQFMPSQGWRKGEGPFANAQCRSARSALIAPR